ncbi:MAG: cytochrome c [Hyphomicrobiales bacterium]|nr:cytochrome c [Hyphomicrobiales bacterium]
MRYALLFTAFALVHLAGSPAKGADVAAGAELAAESCSRCHDIGPDGAFKQFPPSFASIAAYRSREQIYYRIVAPPSHSGMPDVAFYLLGREQVEDLLAYIVSLEK